MKPEDERRMEAEQAMARAHRDRPAPEFDPLWTGRVMARVREAAAAREPAWSYLGQSAWRFAACAAMVAVGLGLASGWATGGFDDTLGLFYLHNPSGIGGMEWMAY